MAELFSAYILKRPEIQDADWDDFVTHSPQYSIYVLASYLDTICPKWEAVVISKGEIWLAVLPLNISRRIWVYYSLKPYLAQYLGPLMHPNLTINEIRNTIEKMMETVSKRVRLFDHCFHPSLTEALQEGVCGVFSEKFRSYILHLSASLSEIYAGFSTSVTNHILKAERLRLRCVVSESVEHLVKMSLDSRILSRKQGQTLLHLWEFTSAKHKGFVLYIVDSKGNVHSGGAFIVNAKDVSFICSATDNRYKKYGANSLLIWEAIKFCKGMNGIESFDFEGSMLPGVERYFKGFRPKKTIPSRTEQSTFSTPAFIVPTQKAITYLVQEIYSLAFKACVSETDCRSSSHLTQLKNRVL